MKSKMEGDDMEMLQAYQGYFEKGRFVSPEVVTIPDKARVIVMLLGDELMHPLKTKGQRQVVALDRFVASINSIKDEPISNKAFEELENNRAIFVTNNLQHFERIDGMECVNWIE